MTGKAIPHRVIFYGDRLWGTMSVASGAPLCLCQCRDCQGSQAHGPIYPSGKAAAAAAKVLRSLEPSQMRRSATFAIGPANRAPSTTDQSLRKTTRDRKNILTPGGQGFKVGG